MNFENLINFYIKRIEKTASDDCPQCWADIEDRRTHMCFKRTLIEKINFFYDEVFSNSMNELKNKLLKLENFKEELTKYPMR